MSNQRCERRFHVTGLDFFGKSTALGSQDPFDEILVAAKFRSMIAAYALKKYEAEASVNGLSQRSTRYGTLKRMAPN